jgi:hypothetical protein
MCILEICGIKQSVLGFLFPKAKVTQAPILLYNCFTPKNIATSHWYISNANQDKICHLPELRISQKIIPLE